MSYRLIRYLLTACSRPTFHAHSTTSIHQNELFGVFLLHPFGCPANLFSLFRLQLCLEHLIALLPCLFLLLRNLGVSSGCYLL